MMFPAGTSIFHAFDCAGVSQPVMAGHGQTARLYYIYILQYHTVTFLCHKHPTMIPLHHYYPMIIPSLSHINQFNDHKSSLNGSFSTLQTVGFPMVSL